MWQSPRFWRTLAWTCTLIAALIFIAWVASATYHLTWKGTNGWVVSVGFGELVVGEQTAPPTMPYWGLSVFRPEFHIWFQRSVLPIGTFLSIPLWLPLLAACAICRPVWRRYKVALREFSVRCPACGYCRTGIASSAPCPECGMPLYMPLAKRPPRFRAVILRLTRKWRWFAGAMALVSFSFLVLLLGSYRYILGWFGDDAYAVIMRGRITFGDKGGPFSIPRWMLVSIDSPQAEWYEGARYFWNNSVVFPLWIPILLTALFAAYLWRRSILAARVAAIGLCPTCGINRAALPATAPCPGCGKPIMNH